DPLTASSTKLDGSAQGTQVPLYPNQPVQLSAVVSDADSAGTGVAGCGVIAQALTYQWAIASQPAGSAAQLNSTSAVSPSFTPDLAGNYTFQLTVTDQTGRSSVNLLNVSAVAKVGTCGTVPPIAAATANGPVPV